MDTHDHHHHALPLSMYIGVGATLFILTGVTVVSAQIDLGSTANLILAMSIATLKASLVALFFMHLLYDSKLYAFIFSVGLFMLTAFIVITMFDTMRRDGIYDHRAVKIQQEAGFYKDIHEAAAAEAAAVEAAGDGEHDAPAPAAH